MIYWNNALLMLMLQDVKLLGLIQIDFISHVISTFCLIIPLLNCVRHLRWKMTWGWNDFVHIMNQVLQNIPTPEANVAYEFHLQTNICCFKFLSRLQNPRMTYQFQTINSYFRSISSWCFRLNNLLFDLNNISSFVFMLILFIM